MKMVNNKAVIISVILVLFGFFHAGGQAKTTNLYDLILSGVPDSTAPLNIVSWQKGISAMYPTVKGQSNNPTKQNGGYYKKVFVNLDIEGQKFTETNVDLDGKSLQGYSSFSISLPMREDFGGIDITTLGKEGYSAKLLNPGGDVLWYKVKFPNKKNVWIQFSEEYISAQSNWFVYTVYFDDNAFKKEKQKSKSKSR